MWWLIPLALGGVAYLISKQLEAEAKTEYVRWQSTYVGVQQQINFHREQIQQHARAAQQELDFHTLCELHFASVKLGNEAHKLFADAVVAKKAIKRSIATIKQSMQDLFHRTKDSTI